MRVIIIGAAGFVGQKLAKALAESGRIDGRTIDRLTLFDVVQPIAPQADFMVDALAGDISDSDQVTALLAGDADLIFDLAAIVSAQAEEDFDLGMRVNLQGTMTLLEACRRLPQPAKLVFTSSVAAYGGEVPPVIRDDTHLNPQTSYGTQKAVGELLVNDYSRKGFVDGRALRLPTVVVRPGKPNRAASTFASSIIREPLQGQAAVCPVSPEVRMWLASPRTIVASLIHAAELPGEALGANRSVLLPGIIVSVGEMVESLRRVGGEAAAARVTWQEDPVIADIVSRWVADLAPEKSLRLGFPQDESMDQIVRNFIEDDLPG